MAMEEGWAAGEELWVDFRFSSLLFLDDGDDSDASLAAVINDNGDDDDVVERRLFPRSTSSTSSRRNAAVFVLLRFLPIIICVVSAAWTDDGQTETVCQSPPSLALISPNKSSMTFNYFFAVSNSIIKSIIISILLSSSSLSFVAVRGFHSSRFASPLSSLLLLPCPPPRPLSSSSTTTVGVVRRSSSTAFFLFPHQQRQQQPRGDIMSCSGSIINHPATACPMTLRGGGLFSTAATTTDIAEEEAAVTATTPVEVFRTDYKPLPYKVTNVNMNFIINDGKTTVHTELKIVPNNDNENNNNNNSRRGDMILNGEASALTLTSIQYNGVELVDGTDYTIVQDMLIIPSSVLKEKGGIVKTSVEIVPETNTQLSGLYKSSSGKMYCTQCEAMG